MQNERIKSFTTHRSRIKGEKLVNLKTNSLPRWEIKHFNEIETGGGVSLEIGSGFGQTVSHLAQTNPQTQFIACEVFIDGISAICSKIEENALQNIRIYKNDARILLEEISNGRLESIYLLFPDPWPKKKHHKRRILTDEFLAEIKRVMKPRGKLWIATDDHSYQEWMIEVFQNQRHLIWENERDYLREPAWWVKTKFQMKAEEAGRISNFFVLGSQ